MTKQKIKPKQSVEYINYFFLNDNDGSELETHVKNILVRPSQTQVKELTKLIVEEKKQIYKVYKNRSIDKENKENEIVNAVCDIMFLFTIALAMEFIFSKGIELYDIKIKKVLNKPKKIKTKKEPKNKYKYTLKMRCCSKLLEPMYEMDDTETFYKCSKCAKEYSLIDLNEYKEESKNEEDSS